MFPSSYIHLGGDETNAGCWDYRPSIKEWMKEHAIPNYTELQSYFRKMEAQYIRANRTKLFWYSSSDNIYLAKGDVVQYWGAYASASKSLSAISNQVILSPYDVLYLDCGTGGLFGSKS